MSHRYGVKRKVVSQADDAAQLQLGDDFADAICVSNAEVFQMLANLEMSTTGQSPSPFFGSVKAHAEAFKAWTNTETIKDVKAACERHQLKPFEMVQLCNLVPSDPEEARALIPSLARMDMEELRDLLQELNNYKRLQED